MKPTSDPLVLKAGSETHLKNRHHSIFKAAVETFPNVPDGSIVPVHSSTGEFLCYATINRNAYIAGRALAFEKRDPMEQLRENIEHAIDLRASFFHDDETTAYRLINAEGDGIPGLIVDRYGDTLVLQLTTLGMDRLRDRIADMLLAATDATKIFEKSTGTARSKEGVESKEGWLRGSGETTIPVKERGLSFTIELAGTQKTGLFLDQRDMRSLVRSIAKQRTVLDVCSYVGGFSLAALAGGAIGADAVDYDAEALTRAKQHMTENDVDPTRFQTYAQDAFDFLRRDPLPRQYDFVILDPPAFAKKATDLDHAKHAYTDLNRMAMQALKRGGLLLTCSCSYQIDPETFQTIVFHAARQTGKTVRILQRHRQAFDHPVNIYHPETDYLKSLLLWVE